MKKAKRQRPLTLFPLHCVACGAKFHPTRADAKACSVTCRKRLQRAMEAGRTKSAERPEPKKKPRQRLRASTPLPA